MIIAKLENKDVEELTLNFKNALGEVIQYDTTYFKDLERLETITLNGFDVNNDLIEKLNCLKKLKIIIFNHCKFICDYKIKNDIENIIITYSNIANSNIFEKQEKIKTIELIGIDEIDINNLTEMKNLVEISIYNSKIKNSRRIRNFNNLKVLKLDGSLVDEPNFSDIIDNNIEFSYKEKFYLEGGN